MSIWAQPPIICMSMNSALGRRARLGLRNWRARSAPQPALGADGRSALSLATFEAGLEGLLDSKGNLNADDQTLILSILVYNFLASQVVTEVEKGLRLVPTS